MLETIIINNKGQVTIPVSIRKAFGFKTGDELFISQGKNSVELKKKYTLNDLVGMFSDKVIKPVTVAEMNEARVDYLTENDKKITQQYKNKKK